eukprot:432682_1
MGNFTICCSSKDESVNSNKTSHNLTTHMYTVINNDTEKGKVEQKSKYNNNDKFDNHNQEVKLETITWDHIITAIEYQLYPKISKSLENIVKNNKEFKEIKITDLSVEIITKIVNKLSAINNLSKEESVFIEYLINNATTFDPITQREKRDAVLEDNVFGCNGILYWLGAHSDNNSAKYHNPVVTGHVKLFSSLEIFPTDHPIESITDRKSLKYWVDAKSGDDAWFMIDLLNVKIMPTHYALRQPVNKGFLRNWCLEVSNNSTNGSDGDWVKLRIHKHDTTLNRMHLANKWSIQISKVNGNKLNKMYSQFKITQTGRNSWNTNTLCISDFEIYGIGTICTSNKEEYDNNSLLHYVLTSQIPLFDICSVYKTFLYGQYGRKHYTIKNELYKL